MKRILIKFTILIALIGLHSVAYANDNSFFTYADVIEVQPIVTQTTVRSPVTSCRIEKNGHRNVVNPRNGSFLPAILGGVIGGAIGNQFGDGNGRKALTAIGVVTGASIAANAYQHDSVNGNDRHRVCHTSQEFRQLERVDGYIVTYSYLGREFSKRTDDHPGNKIRIRVDVAALS